MNEICWDLYLCMGLGMLSFVFSFIITVSQFYETVRTKNTSGISLPTYIIFTIACIICFAWAIMYYFKTLTSCPSESVNPAIPPPDTPAPYGPYWLWQWTVIPIMSYYLFNIILGVILTGVKIYHIILARKLKMNEMALADYLIKKQLGKEFASNHKLHTRKYFGFALVLITLIGIIIAFAILWMLNVRPQYNPAYWLNDNQNKWLFVWIVNFVGAFAFEAISWPQFVKSLKEKNTSGISLGWAIFLPISMVFSFGYALSLTFTQGHKTFPPDTFGGLLFNGLVVNFGILIIKFVNIHKAHKLGLTELEYTQKYIVPSYEKKKLAIKQAKEAKKAKKQETKKHQIKKDHK